MRLEKAVGLKKGTVLVATRTWFAPEKCTDGREYVMQEDAKPVWPAHSSGRFFSGKQLKPGDKPCNAELPIMDDRKDLVYPGYYGFEVKPQ